MFDAALNVTDDLASRGSRVAQAARCLEEGRFSKAVEICKEHLAEEPPTLSGRLIYARALYHAGQVDSASEQLYHVLSMDPENLVALKYLGDIKFMRGDEHGAVADYNRVLTIDPYCRGLKSPLVKARRETTHTITLRRAEEEVSQLAAKQVTREIPFYTETIADLYLAQGYPRLAAEVYRNLSTSSQNPRLLEKLNIAEEKSKHKENSHVKKTD
ncbi:MAG: tetratricopeptide repeat protein [Candidatus Zixiibacteriota bacterium]|nr:MAG: tetratricopeptide repeat protein [candidate division Zixibacteria bacterium]